MLLKHTFSKMPVNEGGRSRRFGKLRYLELLQKNADVEATVQIMYLDETWHMLTRGYQTCIPS